MGPRPLVSITIIKIHTAHSPQSMHGYRHVHASYWLQIALHGQRSDRHRTKRPGGLFGEKSKNLYLIYNGPGPAPWLSGTEELKSAVLTVYK